ncbi:MAG TPA: lytic murein transglycosylase [Thermoleophilaceae bacterium]|nr:lytic murein transglycosylase [Thermoleophilaceae bacterium]
MTQRRLYKRLVYAALSAALLAGLLLAISSFTAGAQLRTFLVRLPTGAIIKVTVDAPPGVPAGSVPGLPGTPIGEITSGAPAPQGGSPSSPSGGGPSTAPSRGGSGGSAKTGSDGASKGGESSSGPASKGEEGQGRSHGGRTDDPNAAPEVKTPKHRRPDNRGPRQEHNRPLRNPDGSPTRHNPTFFDALPTPNNVTSVPNFVIRQFHVPIFLLPIYQAAGNQYGIRWEVLAAINEIETDYGRNLNVSTAGALGWMQFMPATWRMYGVDANGDKKKDPYNPVDAIFAAANYLKAAGAEKDIRKAIFAYNHAGWYVDSVMLRAKLIAGVPGDLVGSLTGLTEGRFPVGARARYADDMAEKALQARKVKAGQNAANLVSDAADRRSINIFASEGAPVIASGDGVIKEIGQSKARGRYIVLQDVYGNQYTYNFLGSVSRVYPVPKVDYNDLAGSRAVSANGKGGDDSPKPTLPASAGRQLPVAEKTGRASRADTVSSTHVTVKPRVYAHPWRPNAKRAGALDQVFNETTTMKGYSNYSALFANVIGLNAKNASLKPLRKGSQVVAGTLLGRVGKPVEGKASHLNFQIRPAGKGAPQIDPKPILDGWKLLESTAIYHANGKNALYGNSASIGQILLLPKPMLEKRVLNDPRVEMYGGGRQDIRTGQIDRRVLATLEFLAESGLRPTVSCLKSGHARLTTSGNVSEHWSGNAVDISAINGTPIIGHQDKGGITEQTVRRLMKLQGTMRPHQIISLLDFGANTLHMADHADHVHVGFNPLFGENKKLGKQALAVLKPGQWSDLIQRLSKLENPIVPTKTSKFALPAGKKRSSTAHGGE